jgi:hypothetical protein
MYSMGKHNETAIDSENLENETDNFKKRLIQYFSGMCGPCR